MIQLRDYQSGAVDATWAAFCNKELKALTVLPTGTGKTEIFSELLTRFLPASTGRAIVLLNKIKLAEQTFRRLGKVVSPLDLGLYCASLGVKDEAQRVIVASIQSIWSLPESILADVQLVIVDEAHNLSDEEDSTYQNFFRKLPPKCKISGYTATPFRATGRIHGPNEFWPRVTFRRSLSWMIERGYIARPTMKKVEHQFDVEGLRVRMGEFASEDVEKLTGDEAKVRSQIKDALPRLEGRKKIVWACSSIAHAELVRKHIQKFEDAAILHSKMSKELQESHTKFFETQDHCRHLCFVNIVTEGYDFAAIDAVALMSPIRSPRRYIQIVGRGLRLHEGKADCLVLDYGKVVETIGPLDDPSIPSKGGRKKSADEPMEALVKSCPKCLTYVPPKDKACYVCGFEFPVTTLSSNLTKTAGDGQLLGQRKPEPKRREVAGVMVAKHIAKSSGNVCIKIEYEIMGDYWPVSEYFSDNPFSWPKGVRRLRELEWPGIHLGSFDDALEWIAAGGWRVGREPKAIITTKDGKWDRVTSLEFGPDEDPRDGSTKEGAREADGAGDSRLADYEATPGLFLEE